VYRAWVALVGPEAARRTLSVCIGATSARACEAAGMTRILYPDSPGIEGWVDSVREALEQTGAPALR
jgi:uroporphyrinogen-III synthase